MLEDFLPLIRYGISILELSRESIPRWLYRETLSFLLSGKLRLRYNAFLLTHGRLLAGRTWSYIPNCTVTDRVTYPFSPMVLDLICGCDKLVRRGITLNNWFSIPWSYYVQSFSTDMCFLWSIGNSLRFYTNSPTQEFWILCTQKKFQLGNHNGGYPNWVVS